MRKNIILSGLILLAFWLRSTTIDSSTKQAIKIDNDQVHTYSERQGKWVILAETPLTFSNLVKEFESSEEEVKQYNSVKSNESIPTRKPIFIPFETVNKF